MLLLFFFSATASAGFSTLSLHDALPISLEAMLSSKALITCSDSGGPLEFVRDGVTGYVADPTAQAMAAAMDRDRKSTRLNSSHMSISYAVFCLKKKNERRTPVELTTTWV